ncbi:protein Tma108p [[Candida] anglica]|uniref:Aminopeptidase n=1 Tax=[Candida] anglica TaxID=148631 RepID=A0ABP0EGX9_9ASCO
MSEPVESLSKSTDMLSIQSGDKLLSLANEFVPTSYGLDLNILPAKNMFNGELSITLKENSSYNGPTSEIFSVTLHSSKLVFTKAVIGDEKLKIVYNKEKETVIFSGAALANNTPQTTHVLHLTYVGQLNTIKTYSDPTFGLFKTNYLDNISGKSNNYIVATHNQPFYTKKVFPLIDEISFKVPIKLTVTTLNKFKVVSNSQLESKDPISMTENAKFSFKETPPMSGHLFALALGDLEFAELDNQEESSTPIRFYTPIGELSKASYALQVATKVLPKLESLFKYKFPLEKLDLVALPFLSDMVMENWGMITFNQHQVLRENIELDELAQQQTRQLIAHELIHQWVGNLVSFDDWKYMWLNESFATWMGNYVLSTLDLSPEDSKLYRINQIQESEQLMDRDDTVSIPSIESFMKILKTSSNSSTKTDSLFDKDIYDKGMVLLKMIGGVLGEEKTLEAIHQFLIKHAFGSVKAQDLWTEFIALSDGGVLSLIHSWIKYESYPIVTIDLTEDKKNVILDQQEERDEESKEQSHPPYHLPLQLKVIKENESSTSVLNNLIVSNERQVIENVTPETLVMVNSDRLGYYRVKYGLEYLPYLESHIKANLLSTADLISILNDYNKYIEQGGKSVERDLIVLVRVLDCFVDKSWTIDYQVLQVGLNILETINSILLNRSQYTEFGVWLEKYTTQLYEKCGGWSDLLTLRQGGYSPVEMAARNSLLSLGLHNDQFQQFGKKLFKTLTNSGINKSFTPKELMPSMFNLVMSSANQKEYKQILAFVKNSNTSVLQNSDCPIDFFQTCAVSSLCFTDNEELLNKSLNFVMTNIDSKLIELGLIGFQFKQRKNMKLKLYDWYKLHYHAWVMRSFMKSTWAVQLRSTLENITNIVLGEILVGDSDLVEKKNEFMKKFLHSLPEHGLKDKVKEYEERVDYKRSVGEAYNELKGHFKN